MTDQNDASVWSGQTENEFQRLRLCNVQICKLCRGCVGTDEETALRSAYLEHLRRRTWRRLIPRPFQVGVINTRAVDMDIHGYIHGYYAGAPDNKKNIYNVLFVYNIFLSVVLALYFLVSLCCQFK